ncbi:Protein peste [Eumeta japonica]|uniref:Protein peste n=1 Tax=Eumeta variegata TaxID=151549 RepID=A0A4C1S8Y3_EUMVA|nr:Protein peste [Eumeta japonica]
MRNNSITTDGHVEVTTGAGDAILPGQIVKWNYEDHLPYYTGQCAELYGSVGEFLPRNLTTNSELHLFLTELCRSVRLEYRETGEHLGLTYYKYAATERTFDNKSGISPVGPFSPAAARLYNRRTLNAVGAYGPIRSLTHKASGSIHHLEAYPSTYHENTCFCGGECGWAGVMNVSACRYGSPAFVSLPHFLHAEPALRRRVTGLQPDPAKHEFYFAVEPKLGVPLHVCARFQLNIKMQPNPHVLLYQDVPETLFPILWIQQMVLMDERIASELRIVRAAIDWGPLAFTGIGVLILLFLSMAILSNLCEKRPAHYRPPLDQKPDVPRDEAEMKLNPM